MKLAELLIGLVNDTSPGTAEIDIVGITLDSRQVEPGFVFVAIAGSQQHGLVHLKQALLNGAVAVLYETAGSNAFVLDGENYPCLPVTGLSSKLDLLANRFYQSPSKKLAVIGVTGTNGKTSCSQFLLQLIADCGVIGTLGWGDKTKALHKTENTTPDVLTIQAMLAEFVRQHKKTVVMEVSSHGLQQGRLQGIDFKAAVFTNLSRDHLDYHGTMEEYLQVKLMLFKRPELEFVVVNADDQYSEMFLSVTHLKVERWLFAVSKRNKHLIYQFKDRCVFADQVKFGLRGIEFVACLQGKKAKVNSKIVGDFNLENLLGVMTVLLALGYSLDQSAKKMSLLEPVSGRMEKFGGGQQPYVFVDYAHTPDALEKLLTGLRKQCQQQLVVVFGCGGDRDRGKRAMMGRIAERYADQIFITNDNPRYEDEQQIMDDILSGCVNQNIKMIKNRELAIQLAICNAHADDCVVIAGKGHENYQDIAGVKHYFSDQKVVEQALQNQLAHP